MKKRQTQHMPTAQEVPEQEQVQPEAQAHVEQEPAQLEPALADLQARIQQLEQESANNKDLYLRTAADLKNFKRRTEEERANLIRNATAHLIMKLLPVLDDFDLAMQHVPPEVAETPWFGGMEGIYRKLQLVLESEGVTPIEALGQPFDPHFHEAVMHEPAGRDQIGKVTADLRRGYTLHDKVVRPSMVKVGQEEQ
jgi:molecular chaperone GrpE